jgi:predicted ATPase
MRLRRLYIEEYLLLRDLDLTFDRPGRLDTGAYALDFLVGLNGSGKSTVLRALTQIITDLRADRISTFSYELEYEFTGRDRPYFVSIAQQRTDEGPSRQMTVRPRSPTQAPIFDANSIDQRYLPARLIVHTTGAEEEWERLLVGLAAVDDAARAEDDLLSDPVRRSVVELPGHLPSTSLMGTAEAEPPFLLIRASRLPLVTLCGLLAHLAADDRPLADVLNSLGLQRIPGFSLRFRLHKALSPFETFKALAPFATRHIQQGNDHLLVFDLSADPGLPSRLVDDAAIGGSLGLFAKLDRLLQPDLSGEPTLRQVNVFLERRVPDETEDTDESQESLPRLFLLDWLSDGEQSFLGRMAMLAMLDTEDSLILLDEPEVHFNDYWKREIVALLNMVMQGHTNHLLIATHSSIVLSDVTEAHITSLVRTDEGVAEPVDFTAPTFGADPSTIMIHVFDTGTAVGAFSAQYIASALDRNDEAELRDLLGRVGVGYWQFRILNRLEKLDAS